MTLGVLVLVITTLAVVPVHADPLYISGRINSTAPSRDVLYIEEVGPNGSAELVPVDIGRARVVRVWRDEKRPWVWRFRETAIHRWPSGTFVVVIGSDTTSGGVEARRVEIPRLDAR